MLDPSSSFHFLLLLLPTPYSSFFKMKEEHAVFFSFAPFASFFSILSLSHISPSPAPPLLPSSSLLLLETCCVRDVPNGLIVASSYFWSLHSPSPRCSPCLWWGARTPAHCPRVHFTFKVKLFGVPKSKNLIYFTLLLIKTSKNMWMWMSDVRSWLLYC